MWSRRRRRSAIADQIDPERRLALSYVAGGHRAAIETLWLLDGQFAQLLSSSVQPIAVQLKLAWWRESLVALDERAAPAEPLLQAIQMHVIGANVSGAGLAVLADGWEHLLAGEALSDADLASYAEERGGLLFRLSAQLLGGEPIEGLEAAGAGWALVDLARHSSHAGEARAALDRAAAELTRAPGTWPVRLRSLGMLALLARRDAAAGTAHFETQGSPARMFRMLAHRLTGR